MTTSKTIRLNLSGTVQFDVRFTLLDGSDQRHEFGFRAEADRAPAASGGETIGAFMADRANVRMLRWLGDVSPLKDAETDADIPPGPEALAALFEWLPNMAGMTYEALLGAMQARAIGR